MTIPPAPDCSGLLTNIRRSGVLLRGGPAITSPIRRSLFRRAAVPWKAHHLPGHGRCGPRVSPDLEVRHDDHRHIDCHRRRRRGVQRS